MKRIEWELMRPQDIECRPAQIKDGKATLLLFQNSRTAMDALDRKFGEFGWTIEYKDVGGQIYGRLSIWDEDTGMWVYREDTGDESNISAQKGQSSDILKRCAVRFGYGRELYTAPRIVVEDDGYGCSGYKVSYIDYNENREIIRLMIVNRFGKTVFDYVNDGYTQTPVKMEEIRFQARKQEETDEQRRLGQLQVWYDGKVKDPSYDRNELDKFKAYYTKQAATFRYKNMDCDILWNNWVSRMRAS